MQVYEQSLGLLLRCAFQSVETLQTLDFPLLLQHISEVLTFGIGHPEVSMIIVINSK